MQENAAPLIVLGFIAFFVLLWWTMNSVRKSQDRAWADFAKAHGLENPRRFHAEGKPGGRTFRAIGAAAVGKEMPTMRIEVEVLGAVPEISLSRQGLLDGLLKLAGGQDIEVGDPAFDKKVVIQGADPAAVRAYLTPRRREAALRLARFGATFSGRRVSYEQNSVDTSAAKLGQKFDELTSIAKELDGATDM